jgi:hypothetical protein
VPPLPEKAKAGAAAGSRKDNTEKMQSLHVFDLSK